MRMAWRLKNIGEMIKNWADRLKGRLDETTANTSGQIVQNLKITKSNNTKGMFTVARLLTEKFSLWSNIIKDYVGRVLTESDDIKCQSVCLIWRSIHNTERQKGESGSGAIKRARKSDAGYYENEAWENTRVDNVPVELLKRLLTLVLSSCGKHATMYEWLTRNWLHNWLKENFLPLPKSVNNHKISLISHINKCCST